MDEKQIPGIKSILMDEKQYLHLITRLNDLERHMVNLIHPIQQISAIFTDSQLIGHLLQQLAKPIMVDDRKLRETVDRLFTLNRNLEDLSENLDVKQTYAEIKYIGNRLEDVDRSLRAIADDGIRKNVSLEVTLDGVPMEKSLEKKKAKLLPKKKRHKPRLRK